MSKTFEERCPKRDAPSCTDYVPCQRCDQRGALPYSDWVDLCCSMCQGWGWHHKDKTHSCQDDATWIGTVGRCLNRYRCNQCQQVFDIDSSD